MTTYIYVYIYGILIGFSSVSESNSELHCGEYFVILLVTLLTIKSAVASAAFWIALFEVVLSESVSDDQEG